MIHAAIIALTTLVATLVGSRGLFWALKHDVLAQTHDMQGYAIYLTEFHENIKSGNFVPVWAANLQFGYGEPHLQFRPPLQLYLTELFYLITGKPFLALNLTAVFIIALSASGMYLVLRRLLKLLNTQEQLWTPIIGSIAYALSPYLLKDLYVRGALSELSCFAVLPFLMLAFIALAQKATLRRVAAASLAYIALALSHPSIQLMVTPFLLLAVFLYRKKTASLIHMAAAVTLGLAGSSFYWAGALFEKHLVKAALIPIDSDAFNRHFLRLDQLAVGGLALIGFSLFLWRSTLEQTKLRWSSTQRDVFLHLFLASMICAYFCHSASAIWYEAMPWLQVMSFPSRWLLPLTFAGTVLGAAALSFETKNQWVWMTLGAGVIAFGAINAKPVAYSTLSPKDFTGPNIAERWGWPKPATSPVTTAMIPTQTTAELVTFKLGRGESACTRKGPTSIACEIMAIQNATLRLNVLDYPTWEARVDGKIVSQLRDPIYGTPLLSLTAGKHLVEWKLRHTKTRITARAASIVALIIILILLFQNKIGKSKTLVPKHAKNFDL